MLQILERRKLEPKLDFSVLQEQYGKGVFKKLIVEALGYPDNEQDANDNFKRLQQSLKAVAKKVIPPKPRRKHKLWI